MSDIERWNPSNFKDAVEKRIREIFVDLIPEEAFQKMVSDALDNFTTGRMLTDTRGHGENKTESQRYWPSGLEQLVEKMLEQEVRQQIRSMLQSDEWRTSYQGVVGEELAKIVHKATPAIIQTFVTSLVEGIIERGRQGY